MISDDSIDPYIVFPEGDGYEERMVQYEAKPGKRPVFIILDGTWRQARRMFRHSRYLDHLPVIQPVVSESSNYHLRKAAVDGQLCTAEVAAAMLQQAHDEKGAKLLTAYFSIFNDHYKAARLSRPLDDESEAKGYIRQLKT